jgi:penicillin-binding protein 1C
MAWKCKWAAIAALSVAGIIVGQRLWPHRPLADLVPVSTAVYAADGRLLRLTLASDQQFRIWTPLEEISPQLTEALLLHEDRFFWWHAGVNPVALSRAAMDAARGRGHAGASTITMQLARRIYGLHTRSVAGKLEQVAAAMWLTARYSKHEILEAHLNLVPYGGNVQGVGAASLSYFAKPAARLSLAESLALVVIPQSPQARTPGGAEPNGLHEARARLLARWQAAHPEDAAALRLAREPLQYGEPAALPFHAPHLTDALIAAAPGRRQIRSTVDLRLQRLLEHSVAAYVDGNRSRGIANATALLVDVRTMGVRALVGSANYHDDAIDGQVNGVLAKRSPGSTLKPFIYALAMDQGLIHPRTVLKDAPVAFGPYAPENFDGAFVGPIAAHDALIASRNVPAVSLAARLSQPSFYEFLRSAGISRLASERHYGLALALGGGEVTMEELATLYAALGNGGLLRPLRYTEDAPTGEGTRILSPESSFMVLDILTHNPRPGAAEEGTSSGRPLAWKTGTSWGFRDAWSAGLVGSYALIVWVGNFDGRGNPAFVGARAAAPLFFSIADAVDSSEPTPAVPGLRVPITVRKVEVCAASGDLPNADCPRRIATWYVPGRSPIRVSTIHRRLRIDTRTGRQACPDTPAAQVREEIFEFWPSDLAALFARAGMPRRPPAAAGECAVESSPPAMRPQIQSPVAGAAYQLRARRVGQDSLSLLATADGAVQTLYWFVDSGFVGAAPPSVAVAWTLQGPGEYTLSVVDDRGASDSRSVRVGLVQ